VWILRLKRALCRGVSCLLLFSGCSEDLRSAQTVTRGRTFRDARSMIEPMTNR
jgi:hypothetical protein